MKPTQATETWARRGLYFCGAWNIAGGLSALADPSSHFAQMYGGSLSLSQPLEAFFFRATWINVIAWGIAYLVSARRAESRTAVLLAGAAGKLAYFAACMAVVQSGAGSGLLAATAAFDVVCAAFFLAIVRFSNAAPQRG